MKINFIKSILLLASFSLIMSCGEDELAPIQINAEEFVMSINENPEIGTSIGFITATTNRGKISYEITSQEPVGAIAVDPDTGEITVGDESLFDYEERAFTTAMIMVSNEDKEDAIVARVNIVDVED